MNIQNVFTVLSILGFALALAACIYALVSYIKLKRLQKRNCEKFDTLLPYPRSTDKAPYYGSKTMLLLEYADLVSRQEAIVRKILEEDPSFDFSKSSMSEYNPGGLWNSNFCKKTPRVSSREGKPVFFDYAAFRFGDGSVFYDEQRYESSEDKPNE